MKTKNKDGFILGLTMIILIILGFFGVATLSSGKLRGLAAIRSTQNAQAFWAAEGGLEYAKALLEADYDDVDDVLPDSVTISGHECTYLTEDGDDDYTTYLYATVVSDSGKTIQLKLTCTADSITKYAWGSFAAGCWEKWGQDYTGGTNAVNTSELSIIWPSDAVVGGPFCTYDMLVIPTSEMNFGYTSALNFFGDIDNSDNSSSLFYGLREDGNSDEDPPEGSDAETYAMDQTTLYTALPNGFEYLGCYDTVMKNRNTGDGNAVYDYAPTGTIIETARSNYLSIVEENTSLVSPASGSTPTNVYEIVFTDDGGYTVYQGFVYLEASVTKGVFEKNQAGKDYDDYVRYYMDRDDDNYMDIKDSYDTAEEVLDNLSDSEDLPIFLNLKYERYNDTAVASGTIESDGSSIIYINADLYISGTLKGYLTLEGADNIYIDPAGITFESAPSENWEDWADNNSDLNTILDNAGIDSFYEAITEGDNLSTIKDDLSDWMESNITDMLTLMAKRQVIMLGDDNETGDINVHAATVIPWDVDPNFGLDMEIILETEPFWVIDDDTTNSDDVVFYEDEDDEVYEALAYSNEIDNLSYDDRRDKWEYTTSSGRNSSSSYYDDLEDLDDSCNISEIAYTSGDWHYYGGWEVETGVTTTNTVFPEGYELDNIKKRPASANEGSRGGGEDKVDGTQLSDEFYKDYMTVGFSPWDKHCKDSDDSNCNIFGGMLEFRHSRYHPGQSGMKRNFLYDWRLMSDRTEGIESEGYSYNSWERVPSSEIYTE